MPVHIKVPSIEKQIRDLKAIFGEDSKKWVPNGFPRSHTPPKEWKDYDITRLWSLAIRNLARVQLHDLMHEKMLERCSATNKTDQTVNARDLKAVYDDLQPKFALYDAISTVYGCRNWPEFAPSGPMIAWDAELLEDLAGVAERNGPKSKEPLLNVHIKSALQARSAEDPAVMEVADILMAEDSYHVDGIKKNWDTLEDWLPEGSMQHLNNPEEWSVSRRYWLWRLSKMALPEHCDTVKAAFLARLEFGQRSNPDKILLNTRDIVYVFKSLKPKKHPECEWRRFLVGKMSDTIKRLNRKDGLITAGAIDAVAMTYGRDKDSEDVQASGGSQEFTPEEQLLLEYEEEENLRLKKEKNKLKKKNNRLKKANDSL